MYKLFSLVPNLFQRILQISGHQFIYFLLSEHRLGKNFDFHKTEEISKLFDSTYSEEIINKVKNFYFKANDLENQAVRLESTCDVSKSHLFFILFLSLYIEYVFVYNNLIIFQLIIKVKFFKNKLSREKQYFINYCKCTQFIHLIYVFDYSCSVTCFFPKTFTVDSMNYLKKMLRQFTIMNSNTTENLMFVKNSFLLPDH